MPFVEIKTPCFPDGTIGVSGLVLYKNSQLFEPRSFFYTSLLMLFFMPRFSQPEKQQVDLQADKKALRSYYSGVRNALGPEECSRASSLICDVIRSLDEYKNAEYVAAFSALGAEPDLSPLFSEKRLFLPRYVADKGVYEMVYVSDVKNDLVIGKYGIAEPRRELEAAGEEWCRKICSIWFLQWHVTNRVSVLAEAADFTTACSIDAGCPRSESSSVVSWQSVFRTKNTTLNWQWR